MGKRKRKSQSNVIETLSKKQKQKQNKGKGKNKGRKFHIKKNWIEKCTEKRSVEGQKKCEGQQKCDLTILITRVELTDELSQNATLDNVIDKAGNNNSTVTSRSVENNSSERNIELESCETALKFQEVIDDKLEDATASVEKTINENSDNTSRNEPSVGKTDCQKIKLCREHKTDEGGVKGDITPSKAKHVDMQKQLVNIVLDSSARGETKRYRNPYPRLRNGDCGDGIVNQYPKTEVADKFWAQRKRLFAKYDSGIKLDRESWYSVTPEVIANHIALSTVKLIKESSKHKDIAGETKFMNGNVSRGGIVLDLFCGCGGNAIAFAKLCSKTEISLVVCIDSDESKLRMAMHNASLYDIPTEKMIFIHADAIFVLECYNSGKLNLMTHVGKKIDRNIAKKKNDVNHCYKFGDVDLLPSSIDCIFLSPPWGGMEYMTMGNRGYSLSNHMKISPMISAGHDKVDDLKPEIGNTSKNPSTKMSAINGEQLLAMTSKASKHKSVVFYLPRNMNGINFGHSAIKAGYRKFEMEQNFLMGKLKTITVYLNEA